MSTMLTNQHNLTLADLEAAGGGVPKSEQPVDFTGHQFNGTGAFSEDPLGSIPEYERTVRSEYEQVSHKSDFKEHYHDVAVAVATIARSLHGGVARSVKANPFTLPAEMTIDIGFDDHGKMRQTTVPGDWMSMPGLQNSMVRVIPARLGEGAQIQFQYPRLFKRYIDGFIAKVHDHLRDHSIFRGKVINTDYEFVWVDPIDPDTIVYNKEVRQILGPWVLSTITKPSYNEAVNVSNKVGICLAGPFGTGKSLFIQSALDVAHSRGCTVVMAKAGADVHELRRAFTIADRYNVPGEVAVVICEDIEKVAGDADSRAQLLDLMDGAAAKMKRRLFITTTNFVEKLDQALMRPGRIDQLIEMPLPDIESFEKLIRLRLGAWLSDDIDWEAAFPAFEGYTQSWITGSTESVMRSAVWNSDTLDDLVITTDDLIAAANAYRPQFEMQKTGISDSTKAPTFEDLFLEAHRRAIESVTPVDATDYDEVRNAADSVVEQRIHQARINLETESGKEITGSIATN